MRYIFIIIAAISAITGVSCKSSSSSGVSDTKDTIALQSYNYYFHEEKNIAKSSEYPDQADSASISVDINFQLPKDTNSVLSKRIREWVNEQISNSENIIYQGNLAEGQRLTDFYGEAFKKELESTLEPPVFNGYRYTEISAYRGFENHKCITWLFTYSQYTGGAHGFVIIYGATFRKADGRRFGHDLLANNYDATTKLTPMMLSGLCEYFEADQETVVHDYTDSKITEWQVALPKYGPWFTEGGVEFLYQQYEIAAYAAGMPSFTIPYAKMEGILSHAAAELLK